MLGGKALSATFLVILILIMPVCLNQQKTTLWTSLDICIHLCLKNSGKIRDSKKFSQQ